MFEHNYIAIEGVIGAGKTSLAMMIAEATQSHLILEEVEENPFLSEFYTDIRGYAFQTQIFFLLSRHKQQKALQQMDLFREMLISDYLFDKDQIFASITLDENELMLYHRLFDLIEIDIPKPDLVIYLQASTDVLTKRIKHRNRPYERLITREYIDQLNEAYNNFFFNYSKIPLLVVNADQIDFVNKEEDFSKLVRVISEVKGGIHYYNP